MGAGRRESIQFLVGQASDHLVTEGRILSNTDREASSAKSNLALTLATLEIADALLTVNENLEELTSMLRGHLISIGGLLEFKVGDQLSNITTILAGRS